MSAIHRRSASLVATAVAAGLLAAVPLQAQTHVDDGAIATRLLVRVVAHDAKVIGSGVGGARVTVRDAATGEVLAEGVQEGSTGDTDAIMGARERGATVFDVPGTGAFEATLQLQRPTRVLVEAEGPLGTPHAIQTASASLLMVPGADVVGEGLVLVLYGFTVVLEAPTASSPAAGPLPVRAHVTMLCGCPITPGGLWDADRITVAARLLRDGEVVAETRLAYAGTTSTFAGTLVPPGPGRYELRVTAVDAARANTGIVATELTVGPS